MATGASQIQVGTLKDKFGLKLVVKLPQIPGIGVMALKTGVTEYAIVLIVHLVACRTAALNILE